MKVRANASRQKIICDFFSLEGSCFSVLIIKIHPLCLFICITDMHKKVLTIAFLAVLLTFRYGNVLLNNNFNEKKVTVVFFFLLFVELCSLLVLPRQAILLINT